MNVSPYNRKILGLPHDGNPQAEGIVFFVIVQQGFCIPVEGLGMDKNIQVPAEQQRKRRLQNINGTQCVCILILTR
jgi:hypothetical protein